MLALIAVPNKGFGHGLFNDVTQRDLAVLLELLAGERYMRFLLAKPTARLSTLGILTSKFPINLHWRTLHLEITERTF